MRIPLLLAALLVAGCLGGTTKDSASPSPQPQQPLATAGSATVLGAHQESLPASAFAGELPRFEQRMVAGRPAGEPTLAISRDGTLLYPAIAFDTPGQTLPRTKLFATKDSGTTWTDVTPCVTEVTVPAPAPAGGSLCAGRVSPYSFDPMVYGDRDTGRLFNLDLQAAGGSWISWSDDGGATWQAVPVGGGNPQESHDHQTLFGGPGVGEARPTGYPNVLYYCVNTGGVSCGRSLDGGTTWGNVGSPAIGSCRGGLHGHGVVARSGVAYLPQSSYCDHPLLHISRDGGATWTESTVNGTLGGDDINETDPSVAVDESGNVYYFWLDGKALPRLAVSRDGGATFGPAWNVTVPGLRTANYPTIVAGDQGRVAFLYYATTYHSPKDPGKDAPGFAKDYRDANPDWNAYVGLSLNADGDAPVFATTLANDPADPLAKGACLFRCYGVYDFLDIDIHPRTGQVYVALVDVCTGACAQPGGKPPTAYPAGLGAIGVQVAGARLRG
jgi:hypothetical protein